jgi:hypothetical protein
MIIIVYGSILPPFPNKWALSSADMADGGLISLKWYVQPPTLPPTPFHAQWARPVNCQNR